MSAVKHTVTFRNIWRECFSVKKVIRAFVAFYNRVLHTQKKVIDKRIVS